jgi:hypothetical protein
MQSSHYRSLLFHSLRTRPKRTLASTPTIRTRTPTVPILRTAAPERTALTRRLPSTRRIRRNHQRSSWLSCRCSRCGARCATRRTRTRPRPRPGIRIPNTLRIPKDLRGVVRLLEGQQLVVCRGAVPGHAGGDGGERRVDVV